MTQLYGHRDVHVKEIKLNEPCYLNLYISLLIHDNVYHEVTCIRFIFLNTQPTEKTLKPLFIATTANHIEKNIKAKDTLTAKTKQKQKHCAQGRLGLACAF